MASSNYRAEKAGFAREVQERLLSKYDGGEAAKIIKWIKSFEVMSITPAIDREVNRLDEDQTSVSAKEFYNLFRNGLILGYIMCLVDEAGQLAKIQGAKTWQESDKPAFEISRQRERIGLFINFARSMGVDGMYLFQTDQLYEETNISQVMTCLIHLGIEVQTRPDYKGPKNYWPNKHQENKRNFSKEQLNNGNSIISLQMGHNQGANASGVRFGGRRNVTDFY